MFRHEIDEYRNDYKIDGALQTAKNHCNYSPRREKSGALHSIAQRVIKNLHRLRFQRRPPLTLRLALRSENY